MKIASLDLGSNSFLLLLCEANEKGITKVHTDLIDIVRLGQGLVTHKKFLPEALVRAQKTLNEFKTFIEAFKPDLILAKATAAARISGNKQELLNIGKTLKIPIEVISGEKEAQVTYQGVFWGEPFDKTDYNLLIDIGGGSTELIVGRGMGIEYSISLPFGAVLLTERFIKDHPVSEADEKNLNLAIASEIEKSIMSIAKFPIKNVYAVAGTPTTIAQIILGGYDDAKINGYKLSVAKLKEIENKLKLLSVEQRISDLGVPIGRADILYAGALLLRTVIEAIRVPQITVSTRGMRHGIVADYFLNQDKQND